MARFVLIHGAWHGAWCWSQVLQVLRDEGHQAVAPDLPGHGADQTPPAEVTLQSYTDRVCKVLDAQGEGVILVGHSMGGAVVSQAAEYRSAAIGGLAYLAAVIPASGEIFAQAPGSPAIQECIVPSEDGTSAAFRPEAAEKIFYADCSSEDIAYAKERLCPQPMAPVVTPFELSPERFGRLPRYYIECLRDKAILPEDQKRIYTRHPCEVVYSLVASHSPFFSMPRQLADILIEVAERVRE
jgi:pimeloyl-ACP methyl ester carboxylesterase